MAIGLALLAGNALAAADLQPVPIEALRATLAASAPHAFTTQGVEMPVDGTTVFVLPFMAQVVELDVMTTGVVTLTWAARTPGRPFRPLGPPWRHLTLAAGRSTVSLDLRIAKGWTPASQPVLRLTGAGTVVIGAIRTLPVIPDGSLQWAAYDRANFWAPESIGHTTINFLTPSLWSPSGGTWLSDVVAGFAALAFAAVLAAAKLRRRRLRPALALAVAALVAVGLWNLHQLVRFLPAFDLRPTVDVEERIRDNYFVAPDVGALAALARATLRPDERVGTMGPPKGWFSPQTLCFNVAPRPCAVVLPGETVHRGISGVGTLRDDELDAVIAHSAGPLPDGFVPVASLGPSHVVARRR